MSLPPPICELKTTFLWMTNNSENDCAFMSEGITTPNEDDDDERTFMALELIYTPDDKDDHLDNSCSFAGKSLIFITKETVVSLHSFPD